MTEHVLTGGNASGPVVRVGDTVRKPWTDATASATLFVQTVRACGVDAPAPMGRDELGRQVQEFVPGRLAIDAPPLSTIQLRRVGSIVRAIHDASATFTPPPDATWETAIAAPGDDLVCHNDLAPWNLIIGERWVFIDWDAAAPSTRLWDLAYAAQTFTLSDPSREPARAAEDLAAFVDGYGADTALCAALPGEMVRRAAAMHELLSGSHRVGCEPWASMYVAGHGEHWRAVTEYVERHESVWSNCLGRPLP